MKTTIQKKNNIKLNPTLTHAQTLKEICELPLQMKFNMAVNSERPKYLNILSAKNDFNVIVSKRRLPSYIANNGKNETEILYLFRIQSLQSQYTIPQSRIQKKFYLTYRNYRLVDKRLSVHFMCGVLYIYSTNIVEVFINIIKVSYCNIIISKIG